MSRAICKQALAVSVLLAILATIAPVPAQAAVWAPGDGATWSSSGLAWLSVLWDRLAALVVGGGNHATGATRQLRPKDDPSSVPGNNPTPQDGSYINPDGQPK